MVNNLELFFYGFLTNRISKFITQITDIIKNVKFTEIKFIQDLKKIFQNIIKLSNVDENKYKNRK